MKKVDKIFLIDDDSIANFVNQHLIKWLELAEELKVFHSTELAKEALLACIEELDSEYTQEFVLLVDAQLDLRKGLLPSSFISGLPTSEKDRLLVIKLTVNKRHETPLLFRFAGVLNKPITKEDLKQYYGQFYAANLPHFNSLG